MGRIDDLADRHVDEWAALNPTGATYAGIKGYDDQLDDLSPDGFAAQADLTRRTLASITEVEPTSESERVAKEAMVERLGLELERYDAGEVTSELNVISSALHGMRMVFDLMPTEGEEAVANIAARLGKFSAALEQYKVTLQEAAAAGHVSPRAQMIEVAKQCDTWTDPGGDNFFHGLVDGLQADDTLTAELKRGASAATAATAAFGEFLRKTMAPIGRDKQAAGRERYQLASRYFLGARVDLDETYAWGFEELARLESDMRAVSARIAGSGASIDDAVAALDADPGRRIEGKEAFRDWMQALADKALVDLHGTHFDIPEPVRRIECCLAPTSDGGIYYTAPSEDFSRPGGCGGRCRRASPRSRPGARSRPCTTRVCRATTCRSHRRWSGPSCSTAGSGCSAGRPGTARAGRSTPSGSWTTSVTWKTRATSSACSTARRSGPRA
ncbi:hypothetical protein Phou_042270 [Phytohabitans houttuyneae]|uniref:DUF885 domain-containing protein n=1 Tax=Phytohabitans houttuyneae TaxID=1076126 RepID=A0A6V8KEA3_9ACTN|nr:hypothetical protein Phou_042270 [Phytohabitans houttuyneae]